MSAADYDHPPLRAIARYLEMPPAAVATTYLEPSDRATLLIATDLEAILARAHEDRVELLDRAAKASRSTEWVVSDLAAARLERFRRTWRGRRRQTRERGDF